MNELSPEFSYDYKRFGVLYVDDEEMALSAFRKAYGGMFRIFTASGAEEGLKVLLQHREEIGLLMTDQRMPGRTGTWLLGEARKQVPDVVRVLVTAYSDMQAAIDAVNTGGIYRYITKPWDPAELELSLKRGLEFFMVRRERDQLLRQQLSVFRNAMIADRILGLGFLARGLSQHIRNGLVAVRTFLDLAPERVGSEGVRDRDFWDNYYNLAQRQVDRIVGLLQELWSASDVEGVQFADEMELHELIEGATATHATALQEKGLKVQNRVGPALPSLRGDRASLQRLFDSLVKEEVAMLSRGCVLEFSASLEPGDHGTGDWVVIHLTDDGPGLPTDQLRMVFDPFMVRNDSPSEFGINLMASFFIVHHHGGKIEAETRPEGGTRFTIRLPRDPRAHAREDDADGLIQRMLLNQTRWEECR